MIEEGATSCQSLSHLSLSSAAILPGMWETGKAPEEKLLGPPHTLGPTSTGPVVPPATTFRCSCQCLQQRHPLSPICFLSLCWSIPVRSQACRHHTRPWPDKHKRNKTKKRLVPTPSSFPFISSKAFVFPISNPPPLPLWNPQDSSQQGPYQLQIAVVLSQPPSQHKRTPSHQNTFWDICNASCFGPLLFILRCSGCFSSVSFAGSSSPPPSPVSLSYYHFFFPVGVCVIMDACGGQRTTPCD